MRRNTRRGMRGNRGGVHPFGTQQTQRPRPARPVTRCQLPWTCGEINRQGERGQAPPSQTFSTPAGTTTETRSANHKIPFPMIMRRNKRRAGVGATTIKVPYWDPIGTTTNCSTNYKAPFTMDMRRINGHGRAGGAGAAELTRLGSGRYNDQNSLHPTTRSFAMNMRRS